MLSEGQLLLMTLYHGTYRTYTTPTLQYTRTIKWFAIVEGDVELLTSTQHNVLTVVAAGVVGGADAREVQLHRFNVNRVQREDGRDQSILWYLLRHCDLLN